LVQPMAPAPPRPSYLVDGSDSSIDDFLRSTVPADAAAAGPHPQWSASQPVQRRVVAPPPLSSPQPSIPIISASTGRSWRRAAQARRSPTAVTVVSDASRPRDLEPSVFSARSFAGGVVRPVPAASGPHDVTYYERAARAGSLMTRDTVSSGQRSRSPHAVTQVRPAWQPPSKKPAAHAHDSKRRHSRLAADCVVCAVLPSLVVLVRLVYRERVRLPHPRLLHRGLRVPPPEGVWICEGAVGHRWWCNRQAVAGPVRVFCYVQWHPRLPSCNARSIGILVACAVNC
jgi:hypothetical protein